LSPLGASRRLTRGHDRKVVDNHSHLQLNDIKQLPCSQAMYVCICNAVTESMIRRAAAEGARNLDDLMRATGCAGGCGSCADLAEQVLRQARRQRPFGVPLVAQAA